MTATFREAGDEIRTAIKDAWDPTGHPMAYQNVESDPPLPPEAGTLAAWGKTWIRHDPAGGGQATLSGGNGVAVYNRTGTLRVQIFTILGSGTGPGYDLAKIVADALDGKATPSQVWFRGVSIDEPGEDGEWYEQSVFARFEYDEVK